jgi:hypothetical protein
MKMRMQTKTSVDISGPVLFVAHPHLSDSVNHNIIHSEIEGGVHLRDLPPGSVLSIQTKNRSYRMVVVEDGTVLISGHPKFCPAPPEVRINGSTWGGSMVKEKPRRPRHAPRIRAPLHRTILTSRIVDIRAHA